MHACVYAFICMCVSKCMLHTCVGMCVHVGKSSVATAQCYASSLLYVTPPPLPLPSISPSSLYPLPPSSLRPPPSSFLPFLPSSSVFLHQTEEMERSTSARPEVILQPKDPYAERCFPLIIGTEEFKTSERLGLVEYISDGW